MQHLQPSRLCPDEMTKSEADACARWRMEEYESRLVGPGSARAPWVRVQSVEQMWFEGR